MPDTPRDPQEERGLDTWGPGGRRAEPGPGGRGFDGGGPGEPGPALTVAAVARRLGISPTTLRTWDRRYGLGPSGHEAGRHRRYAPGDVARLELMCRLTGEGVPAGEAARLARSGTGTPAPGRGTDQPRAVERPARHGGGHVVPLGRVEDRVRGLARAAQALDAGTVTETVRHSLERRGAVATWDHLVVPVLVGIGERWERTGRGVDVEHLASEAVLAALRSYTQRTARTPVNTRPVLLACAEEEQHSLPLFAVAAALAERQVAARVLGARMPADALASAVRRAGPCAVFVWSQSALTGDPAQLAGLPVTRPPVRLVLGGRGWRGRPVRADVVDDLAEAVGALAGAAGV